MIIDYKKQQSLLGVLNGEEIPVKALWSKHLKLSPAVKEFLKFCEMVKSGLI